MIPNPEMLEGREASSAAGREQSPQKLWHTYISKQQETPDTDGPHSALSEPENTPGLRLLSWGDCRPEQTTESAKNVEKHSEHTHPTISLFYLCYTTDKTV